MSQLKRHIVRTACVILTGLGVGAAAQPAHAEISSGPTFVVPFPERTECISPSACDEKYQYLTSAPNSSMPTSCATRPITLNADNYIWALWITDSNGKDFGQKIAAGGYTWTTCLVPLDGDYYEYSNLDSSTHHYGIDNYVGLPASGYYTWGSSLYPQ
jgi:hypothetical protein